MISQDRWEKAQEYEQGFWEGVAERVAAGSYGQIDFYEWRAGELLKKLEAAGLPAPSETSGIVELGSGPVGVLGFLPGHDRVAVDPLNRYYSSNDKLTELRNPAVTYLSAPGEDVPLESGKYDMVIMENCIDHTQDPDTVMSEIHRLLAPNGILYLTVNARSRPGYWVHRFLARYALDPGHPHTYTEGRFKKMIERHGFDVVQFEAGSWAKAWWDDLITNRVKSRMKGVLFVSEHLLSAVAQKR